MKENSEKVGEKERGGRNFRERKRRKKFQKLLPNERVVLRVASMPSLRLDRTSSFTDI